MDLFKITIFILLIVCQDALLAYFTVNLKQPASFSQFKFQVSSIYIIKDYNLFFKVSFEHTDLMIFY